MRTTPLILAMILGCLLPAGEGLALVAREAIDGDTIVLETGEHVRLIGIDTPEIDDKHHRNSKTAKFEGLKKSDVDAYAVKAKTAADEWLRGQKIKIVKDPINKKIKDRDDYGRLLAYVCRESDGHCLADDLLADGYGMVYRRFQFERKRDFLALEKTAKAEGRGIWAHQTPRRGKSVKSRTK